MGKILKNAWESSLWLRILSITSILLIAAGFICPPLAVIDKSILIATGELAGFGALWILLRAIDVGADAKVKKGDLEIEINNPDQKDNI